MWRSLRHRNYRLYVTGQLVSLCGTWMQQVAQGWLVYRLTGSAGLLGVVGFANLVPVFALGPVAGVITDRFSRHRLVIVTQTVALVQALFMAALTLGGWIKIWQIIALGVVLGFVNAFDMPARQSLVNELVDLPDLPNAIALNSSMFNAARAVGPSLAGILVATVGEGICFLLNALSYLAVIGALVAMRFAQGEPEIVSHVSIFSSMRAGLAYVLRTAPIRDFLVLLGVIGFMGTPYMTLMPVFAGNVLRGGADALGLMMGSVGIGAMAGALLLARRGGLRGLGKITAGMGVGFGLTLMIFSASRYLWLSMIILLGVGFSWMVIITAVNTLLQTFAEDKMRGRVMSLYSMMLMGMAPFGNLASGGLGDLIGVPATIFIDGAFCLLGGLWLAIRLPRLRDAAGPILAARGIIPDPTSPKR